MARRAPSSSDCVDGGDADGAEPAASPTGSSSARPSLEGVEQLGTVHHMGFEDQAGDNVEPAYPATEDIFVAHEAELTQSGDYVLVTDERGGGVLPGRRELRAGCRQRDRQRRHPRLPASTSWARTPAARRRRGGRRRLPGERLREELRGRARDLPRADQHRAAGRRSARRTSSSRSRARTGSSWRWYSQGTQVVDFTENADGTIDFKRAGYFIPENANAVGLAHLQGRGERGRHVHLLGRDAATSRSATPAATRSTSTRSPCRRRPSREGGPLPGTPTFREGDVSSMCIGRGVQLSSTAKPRKKRKRVRFSFSTPTANRAKATIFRQATRRRVARRRVKTFRKRRRAFTWAPKRARNGYYDVRFGDQGRRTVARTLGTWRVRRRNGRFFVLPNFDRRSTVRAGRVRLARPVGLRRAHAQATGRPVQARRGSATSSSSLTRRGKRVRRIKPRATRAARAACRSASAGKAKRGAYRVTLKATRARARRAS